METLSDRRKGEVYIVMHGVLWGFFPILLVLAYATLPSLLVYAWSSVFAAIFFGVVFIFRGNQKELLDPRFLKLSAGIIFFIGFLYYGLFFVGLSYTTPGNAAILALFEVFTSYMLFHLIRREPIPRDHVIGAFCMVLGACVVLAPNFSTFNIGDLLIVLATIAVALGNLFQQKARAIASSESILLLRTIGTIPLIFMFAYFLDMHASLSDIRASLFFLVVNGVVMLGFAKILWTESIHRMSVTKAVAFTSIAPFFTLAFAWVILDQAPTGFQLLSLVPFTTGVLFLTDRISLGKVAEESVSGA